MVGSVKRRDTLSTSAASGVFDVSRTLALADADATAIDSPARRLQLEIEAALAEPEVRQWSPRTRLSIIFCASAVLWAGLIFGLRAIL